MKKISRREFNRMAATSVFLAGTTLARSAEKASESPSNKLRVGFIGVGGRGTGLLGLALNLFPDLTVPAVCDINADAAHRASRTLTDRGRPAPALYTDGDFAWQKMLERDDFEAVIIATPWRWHTPMAAGAMRHGLIAGVEVPCALSLEECWQLVDTSEKTGVACMMLENWSFRSDNLALLNMVREGRFGRIVHVHCAHSHDCIDHWFFDAATGADRWPAEYLLKYNRDQYPTHSVGPVLSWCDINCGDRFTTLTSMVTGSFGINDRFRRRFGTDHPGAKRTYAQGDIVTSTLRTEKGKTVVVNYDMQLPRPYDNRWMLQGTRGVYSEERNSVYLLGKSPAYHQWEPFPPYQAQYSHPWWAQSSGGSHGGADDVMLQQFLGAIRDKKPLPLTIHDSVTMSALIDLSG
ncbi:MAG: Gfo/Idh/MocA family oxidoreductase [Chloroflexi bacterium]|nr:Gfo/Idh/MocA family oxidoreductase [Chloroflexota bacterium]